MPRPTRRSAIWDTVLAADPAQTGRVKVEILHIEECPNWREAGRLVAQALDELGARDVPLGFTLLTTPEQAAAVPFAGSPTILVDGVDAFASDGATAEFACRVFVTEGGLAGTPSLPDIRRVLAERMRQSHV